MPPPTDELVLPPVHDSGDIGKAIAGAPQEGLVGSVFGGVSNELGYRLPLDRGRPLDLLVQLRIKSEASHGVIVSRRGHLYYRSQQPKGS